MTDAHLIQPSTGDIKWRVIHARPRCEKKLAQYAESHGIGHYLPLRRETRIYQRRKVTFEYPLFSGYLFASCNYDSLITLLNSHQVVRTLDVLDQSRLVFELDQIRQALSVDPTLGACRMIQPGQSVRVKSGPFQGIEGRVATVQGRTRVMLSVEMIGQAVMVEVGMSLLEPI
jgi:transcriptional antiterminator RfaH